YLFDFSLSCLCPFFLKILMKVLVSKWLLSGSFHSIPETEASFRSLASAFEEIFAFSQCPVSGLNSGRTSFCNRSKSFRIGFNVVCGPPIFPDAADDAAYAKALQQRSISDPFQREDPHPPFLLVWTRQSARRARP